MKKPKFISTIIVIAFFFSILRPDLIRAQGETPAGQPQKVFLAVMELDLSAGVPAEARTSLSDILREQLWKTGRFRVVDRNNMERIMKEQGFQLSDCTSKECAVKVGQLLGVEEMVTGNVTLLGKTYIISVQMTKVETGEIEKMASDRCPACELDQLIGSIDKVSAALAEAVGDAVAPPKQVSPKTAAAGSLNVYSDPSEAEVYWDGARVGVSAIFLKDLKPGEHRLLLKKEGYAPQELAVSVKPGLNTVQVQLRQLATIIVQGAPDGAQILMDGKAMGTAPRDVMVPAGTHRVELSLAGYKGYSQDFEAREGESRTIGYSLETVEKPREVKAPRAKSKGRAAKGFYYTGLGLTVFGSISSFGLMQERGIRSDYDNETGAESAAAYALMGVSGAGFLTATLSYIFMPHLSGRERAHLAGYSGVDIAATGLALMGMSLIGSHNARSEYEEETDQDILRMNKKLVKNWNTFTYISYGVIGAGALTALISFVAAPAAKNPGRAEVESLTPKVAIYPEIVAYPEGGGYLGARASF